MKLRRTRKKSVNPAQREGEGGPAVRGIEFTSNGGGGEALPRRVKRREVTFTRLSGIDGLVKSPSTGRGRVSPGLG